MNNDIASKIVRAGGYLMTSERLSTFETEEIVHDETKLLALERSFQLLVDEVVDINTLILSSVHNITPETYKSSFFEMSEKGIVSDDVVQKIAHSVKLRNQIVHDYEFLKKNDLVCHIKLYIPVYKDYMKELSVKFSF